jgi:hypothetical protein
MEGAFINQAQKEGFISSLTEQLGCERILCTITLAPVPPVCSKEDYK